MGRVEIQWEDGIKWVDGIKWEEWESSGRIGNEVGGLGMKWEEWE